MDEDAEKYTMNVALPGLSREDICITIKGNTLHVDTQTSSNTLSVESQCYHEYDFSHGHRKLKLPDNADTILIHAFYKGGELTLIIPKGHSPEMFMPASPLSIAIY
jgi:HSP20 family molecular chaperone IbpA